MLPLVMDLANPSPALGWAGEERDSLAARGPATTALALALTHHLALGQNVPLEHLARWLRQLAHQVLVEFVPLTDPQAQSLVSHRAGLFPGYHRAGFEAALRPCFRLQSVTPLPESDRLLYTLEGRPA